MTEEPFMADNSAGAERPLSPHLQIFSPMLTMMMSIAHRITGVALYFGAALLAWWLISAASGPVYFEYVSNIMRSWPGQLVLLGYIWALIHHTLGGFRHFIWDTGHGFGLRTIEWLAWLTLIGSVGLTAIVWAGACLVMGSRP